MKIVFMGTPDFAVGSLKALVEAGHEVVLVVTQPDREKGRGREVTFTPVKEYALSQHIPVFQPVKIKTPEAVAELKKTEADIFVVAAFGQILSKEILEMPRLGCVNVHASLLPKYRGAAPIQWSILNGDAMTGVTIMQMDVGLDTGDILTQASIPIEDDETGDSLFEKLSHLGATLLCETLPCLERGEITPRAQDESQATHVRMLDKSMGRIDWFKSADMLEHVVRGLNSWPGAYCSFRGKTLKIWGAKAMDEARVKEICPEIQSGLENGTVAGVTKEMIFVQTGDGYLALLEVQPESKKRMEVKNFLLGYPVEAGEVLRA
ncbi:MAG: methionyl-tRNA formyltransferase [Lachnospiraceae bacterium]|nr:methionyl-tRNA formyltransferase [Lachnospiraceae bacterium]